MFCTTAAEKIQYLNASEIIHIIWAMAQTGTRMPNVFGAICAKAGGMVQDLNAREKECFLRTMLKTGTHMPDILEKITEAISAATGEEPSTILRRVS